jgi:glycerate 2-kinase
MNGRDLQRLLADVFAATTARLDGESLVRRAVGEQPSLADASHVLAVGKVALPMWRGLSARGDSGAAVAVVPAPLVPAEPVPGLRVLPADHPQPTERSVAAARAVAAFVASVHGDGARLLVLLSGGSSSLMCAPADGLSLADKRAAVAAVAAAGATIAELNTVRKHLSAIKGGRLGAVARVPVDVLALSDVIGDDAAVIGSGPFSPDPSTFAAAQAVIARLGAKVPAAVEAHLAAGARGAVEETPKPGDARLARVRYRIIAGPDHARAEARRQVEAAGFAAGEIGDLPANTEMSVEALAAVVVETARAALGAAPARPRVFVGNGEPTIKVAGDGRGGRATHLGLLVARGLATLPAPDRARVAFLAGGTDDRDGNSDVSGALVDGNSWVRAVDSGLDPQRALDRCDSATLLATLGATIRGPGTSNMLDLHLLAVA